MKRFLFFLVSIVPLVGFAQSNYRAGYVISNSGDSIPGFINYKERDQNASSFTFKSVANGPSKVYKVSDCKAYGLDGIESYERFLVNISLNKVDLAQLSFTRDTTVERDTIFLKVLQRGKKLSLYSYIDHIKSRFYVKEQGSLEPTELIFATYLITEGGKTENYNKYVRQLYALMVKNGISGAESQSRLRTLTYDKKPILAVVSLINNQKPEKGIKATRFFVGAGMNSSKASYSGETVFNGPGVITKKSYAPVITAGVDIFANPHIGRVIYRAELSFTTAKSNIYAPNTDPTLEYKDESFDSYTASFTPQVIWNMYNTNPVKVFIGVGAALNFSSYKNNLMTTKSKSSEARIEKDKVKLEPFYLAPQLSAGIVLKKKIELFGNYQINSAISDYSQYNVCMVRLNVGIKYLFGN